MNVGLIEVVMDKSLLILSLQQAVRLLNNKIINQEVFNSLCVSYESDYLALLDYS